MWKDEKEENFHSFVRYIYNILSSPLTFPNVFKHIEKIASVIRALVVTRPQSPLPHPAALSASLSTTRPSTLSEPPRLPRNWIVILFSKAICKCYQKVSSRHAYPYTQLLSFPLFNPLFSLTGSSSVPRCFMFLSRPFNRVRD